jgi:hypothetical protein
MSRWANFKIKSQKWHWTKNCQGQPTSWMHHHPRFLIKLFFKLAHNLAILPFLVWIPQNNSDVEICTIFRGNYFFFWLFDLESQSSHYCWNVCWLNLTHIRVEFQSLKIFSGHFRKPSQKGQSLGRVKETF